DHVRLFLRQHLPVVAVEPGRPGALAGGLQALGVVVGDGAEVHAVEALEGGVEAVAGAAAGGRADGGGGGTRAPGRRASPFAQHCSQAPKRSSSLVEARLSAMTESALTQPRAVGASTRYRPPPTPAPAAPPGEPPSAPSAPSARLAVTALA